MKNSFSSVAKQYPKLLIIRKIQIKTIIRCQLTPVRMSITKKGQGQCVGEDIKFDSLYTVKVFK